MKRFTKTIYNVSSKSKKQIADIMNLEVSGLMHSNPGYPFAKYKELKRNKDGSVDYEITLEIFNK